MFDLESEIVEQIKDKLIKELLDVLILGELTKGRALGGYDIVMLVNNKFATLVSPGTVYSVLYSLERNELIEGTWNKRKRVYSLTEKGKEIVKAIMSAKKELQGLVSRIFGIESNVV